MLGSGSLGLVFLGFFGREDPVEPEAAGLALEDAKAEEARLREAGVEIVAPLVDEVYGQRHFYGQDINGVLLDIIEPIAPDPEWLASNGLDR